MNEKLIKDLQEGRCAVKYVDGVLKDLKKILKIVFPNSKSIVIGYGKY